MLGVLIVATVLAKPICCIGHREAGAGLIGVVVVVAKTSMPVLSIPMKTSRFSRSLCCRFGMVALPEGALPAGTIFRKIGVDGSGGIGGLCTGRGRVS